MAWLVATVTLAGTRVKHLEGWPVARGTRVRRPCRRSPAATTRSTSAVSHCSCNTFARTTSRRANLRGRGAGCAGCAGTLVPAVAGLGGRGRRRRCFGGGGNWSRGWGRGLVSNQGEGQSRSRGGSHGRLQVASACGGWGRHGQRRWLEHGRLRYGRRRWRRRGWWRGRRRRRRQQLLWPGKSGAHRLTIGRRREDEHRRRQQGGCGPSGLGSWMHLLWRRRREAPGPGERGCAPSGRPYASASSIEAEVAFRAIGWAHPVKFGLRTWEGGVRWRRERPALGRRRRGESRTPLAVSITALCFLSTARDLSRGASVPRSQGSLLQDLSVRDGARGGGE